MNSFKEEKKLVFRPSVIEDAIYSTIRPKKRGHGYMIRNQDEMDIHWDKEDPNSVLLRAAYYGIRYYDGCVKSPHRKPMFSRDSLLFHSQAFKLELHTAGFLVIDIKYIYNSKIKDTSNFLFEPTPPEFEYISDRFLAHRMRDFTGLILDGEKVNRQDFSQIVKWNSEHTCRPTLIYMGGYRVKHKSHYMYTGDFGETDCLHKFDNYIRWFESKSDISQEYKNIVGSVPFTAKIKKVKDEFLLIDAYDGTLLDIYTLKNPDIFDCEHTVLLI